MPSDNLTVVEHLYEMWNAGRADEGFREHWLVIPIDSSLWRAETSRRKPENPTLGIDSSRRFGIGPMILPMLRDVAAAYDVTWDDEDLEETRTKTEDAK